MGGEEAAGILAFCTPRLIISFFQKKHVTSGFCFHAWICLAVCGAAPRVLLARRGSEAALVPWCGGTGRRFYVNTFVPVWWLGIDMGIDMDMDMETACSQERPCRVVPR